MDQQKDYSIEAVRTIIRKASELQGIRASTVSEADLREIALDLGIDPETLAKAIQQIESASPKVGFMEKAGWWKIPRGPRAVLAALLGGTAAGALTGVIRELIPSGFHGETVMAIGALCLTTLALAVAARKERSHLGFQARSLALWTGFIVGFSAMVPILAGDASGLGTVYAIGSAIVGGIVVAWPGRWTPRFRRMSSTAAADPEAVLETQASEEAKVVERSGHSLSDQPYSFQQLVWRYSRRLAT